MATNEPKQTSVLDRIAKLTEQQDKLLAEKNQLLESAKTELLNKGKLIIDELSSLGFSYAFTPAKFTKSGSGSGVPADKECPVCHFKTSPKNHDKRAHRNHPKAFTNEELMELGLTRVD